MDISIESLIGWEVGSERDPRGVVIRLHLPAGPLPYVGLKPSQAHELVRDVLAALAQLERDAPAQPGLQGSQPGEARSPTARAADTPETSAQTRPTDIPPPY